MISVCYLIVCVNLLYSFVKAESTLAPFKTHTEDEKEFILTAENQDEYLAKLVSPYWNLTYDEQLDRKQNLCSVVVDMMVKRFESLGNAMTCKLLQIVPSPVTKAYRNVDEFKVAYGVDGNTKTVGISVGTLSLRRAVSVRPTKIVTVKESHKRVAQVFEDFIRLSPLPSSPKLHDGGHWRLLLVRSNEAGDVMASVIVQPRMYHVKMIEDQKRALKEYFLKHLPNITLYHQQCIYLRCTRTEAPFILLHGKPYLSETLNGFKFKISPDTFFPINKLGAEVLHDTIIRTAKLTSNTTVLDIYSGAGTISIIASKIVRQVVGIDYMTQSVMDAIENTEIDNITNVKFVLGDVEDNLKSVLELFNTSSDMVAIVNSGRTRPGLEVIKTIRRSSQLSRLVYITGNPESLNSDEIIDDLCLKKKWNSPPFRLTKAIPVDLLPQTAHVELILMFQRSPLRKYIK